MEFNSLWFVSYQLAGFVCFGVFRVCFAWGAAACLQCRQQRLPYPVDGGCQDLSSCVDESLWHDSFRESSESSLVTVWILKICNNKNIKTLPCFTGTRRLDMALIRLCVASTADWSLIRPNYNCSQIFARGWHFQNRTGCDLVFEVK